MRRPLVFAVLVCTAIVGAWALPSAPTASTVESVAADTTAVDPPNVRSPLIVEPLVSVASTTTTAMAAATPSHSGADSVPPAHLSVGVEATDAPEAIVSTTTAPPATTTAPPAVSVTFSAHQKYGSCGEDVPYDIFSGTANPGSTVTISSAYGSATVTADAGGRWERRVEFPAAPRGETFGVVASGVGGSVTLPFTATGGAHS